MTDINTNNNGKPSTMCDNPLPTKDKKDNRGSKIPTVSGTGGKLSPRLGTKVLHVEKNPGSYIGTPEKGKELKNPMRDEKKKPDTVISTGGKNPMRIKQEPVIGVGEPFSKDSNFVKDTSKSSGSGLIPSGSQPPPHKDDYASSDSEEEEVVFSPEVTLEQLTVSAPGSKAERSVGNLDRGFPDACGLPKEGALHFDYDDFVVKAREMEYDLERMKQNNIYLPIGYPTLTSSRELIIYCKGYRTATTSSLYSQYMQACNMSKIESAITKLSATQSHMIDELREKSEAPKANRDHLTGAMRTFFKWGSQIGKVLRREVVESVLQMDNDTYKEFLKVETKRMRDGDFASWEEVPKV